MQTSNTVLLFSLGSDNDSVNNQTNDENNELPKEMKQKQLFWMDGCWKQHSAVVLQRRIVSLRARNGWLLPLSPLAFRCQSNVSFEQQQQSAHLAFWLSSLFLSLTLSPSHHPESDRRRSVMKLWTFICVNSQRFDPIKQVRLFVRVPLFSFMRYYFISFVFPQPFTVVPFIWFPFSVLLRNYGLQNEILDDGQQKY